VDELHKSEADVSKPKEVHDASNSFEKLLYHWLKINSINDLFKVFKEVPNFCEFVAKMNDFVVLAHSIRPMCLVFT